MKSSRNAVSSLTAEELKEIAKDFADRIPEETFSPAEIQGFLLTRKKEPLRALDEVESWKVETLKAKEKKKEAEVSHFDADPSSPRSASAEMKRSEDLKAEESESEDSETEFQGPVYMGSEDSESEDSESEDSDSEVSESEDSGSEGSEPEDCEHEDYASKDSF